jgi:hypothetical protein
LVNGTLIATGIKRSQNSCNRQNPVAQGNLKKEQPNETQPHGKPNETILMKSRPATSF